jgi:ABC-type uncharacterized transport system permease subunit
MFIYIYIIGGFFVWFLASFVLFYTDDERDFGLILSVLIGLVCGLLWPATVIAAVICALVKVLVEALDNIIEK